MLDIYTYPLLTKNKSILSFPKIVKISNPLFVSRHFKRHLEEERSEQKNYSIFIKSRLNQVSKKLLFNRDRKLNCKIMFQTGHFNCSWVNVDKSSTPIEMHTCFENYSNRSHLFVEL